MLSAQRLGNYAIQYYRHVEAFPALPERIPFALRRRLPIIERHDTRPEDRAIALEAGRTALKAVWDLHLLVPLVFC